MDAILEIMERIGETKDNALAKRITNKPSSTEKRNMPIDNVINIIPLMEKRR
jgi:hypothetical protein